MLTVNLWACMPSSLDLARLAGQYRHAVLLWACDAELVLTAVAGELAPLALATPGERLADVLPPESEVVPAHRIALTGQVAVFRVNRPGFYGEGTVAPIRAGQHIIGVVGSARLDDGVSWEHVRPERGVESCLSEPDAPIFYEATRDTEDFRAGDVVTVSAKVGPLSHHEIPPRRFDKHLLTGALRLASVAPTSPDVGPGARPTGGAPRRRVGLRGSLRLLPG